MCVVLLKIRARKQGEGGKGLACETKGYAQWRQSNEGSVASRGAQGAGALPPFSNNYWPCSSLTVWGATHTVFEAHIIVAYVCGLCCTLDTKAGVLILLSLYVLEMLATDNNNEISLFTSCKSTDTVYDSYKSSLIISSWRRSPGSLIPQLTEMSVSLQALGSWVCCWVQPPNNVASHYTYKWYKVGNLEGAIGHCTKIRPLNSTGIIYRSEIIRNSHMHVYSAFGWALTCLVNMLYWEAFSCENQSPAEKTGQKDVYRGMELCLHWKSPNMSHHRTTGK